MKLLKIEMFKSHYMYIFPYLYSGAFFDEVHNPLSANLFGLPAQRWKTLRTKLSPTFSTAKLKAMFSTFLDCGANLQNYLDRMADTQELVEMREMSGHFTTTIIASVVFGCKADAFIDPKNEFRMCAHSLFQPNFLNRVRTFGFFAFPKLLTLLGIRLVNSKNEKFIQLMVKQNLEYREKNHIVRNDFFQLLAQLRNKGTLQDHDQSVNSITEKEIAANTFLFFFAGFESTSSILTFCVYHLAKNPEVQRRVHEEIDRVLAAHNGEINYASISNMKYLEACINGDCFFLHISILLLTKLVQNFCRNFTNVSTTFASKSILYEGLSNTRNQQSYRKRYASVHSSTGTTNG